MIIGLLLPVWTVTDPDDINGAQAYQESLVTVIDLVGSIDRSFRRDITAVVLSLEGKLGREYRREKAGHTDGRWHPCESVLWCHYIDVTGVIRKYPWLEQVRLKRLRLV